MSDQVLITMQTSGVSDGHRTQVSEVVGRIIADNDLPVDWPSWDEPARLAGTIFVTNTDFDKLSPGRYSDMRLALLFKSADFMDCTATYLDSLDTSVRVDGNLGEPKIDRVILDFLRLVVQNNQAHSEHWITSGEAFLKKMEDVLAQRAELERLLQAAWGDLAEARYAIAGLEDLRDALEVQIFRLRKKRSKWVAGQFVIAGIGALGQMAGAAGGTVVGMHIQEARDKGVVAAHDCGHSDTVVNNTYNLVFPGETSATIPPTK